MEYIKIILPLAIIFIASIGMIWEIRREKNDWNGGVCGKSGKPWRHFDIASDGSRGYTDECGNYCWISYNIEK